MALRARHIQDFVKDPINAADVGVGDLCLVSGKDHVKRSLWSLGTIERILPSSDSKPRAVEIRISTGLITRPLEKVCPVRKAHQLRGGPPVNKEDGRPGVESRPSTEQAPRAESDTERTLGAEISTKQAPRAEDRPSGIAASRPARPTRAAKIKGRQRVQGWCEELKDENLL